MRKISFIISDPCFKKCISIDSKECKTVKDLKQKLKSILGLNDDQFIIDQKNPDIRLSSINENYVFKIKILNPSDAIHFLLPDNKKIKISNGSKLTIFSVIKILQKAGLFFSDKFIQDSLSFNLWGIKIPYDGLHFQFVPENVNVNIKFGDTAVTIIHDQKKFLFTENEQVGTAISFIKKQYNTESDFYITKESSKIALDHKYQLKKSEKYLIYNKRSPDDDREKETHSKQEDSSVKKPKRGIKSFKPKISSSQISKASEKSKGINNSKSYTFVSGKNKINLEFEDGTLLNNEIYDFEKMFSIDNEYIEFEIDNGGKERCRIKEDQKIETFKGKVIYVTERQVFDHSEIECSYQTNQSKIIYMIRMKYDSTIKELRKIISRQFNISEPQNIKIMHSNKILMDFVIIDNIDNVRNSNFLVSLPIHKSRDDKIKSKPSYQRKPKSSKMCKYYYQTNESDDIIEVEIPSDSTVYNFKQYIAKRYDVDDINNIKIIFVGKELLDELYLEFLEIGDLALFVYIRPIENIFLMTAKALRYDKFQIPNSDYEEEDDDEYEEEDEKEDKFSFKFLSEELINKIKPQLKIKKRLIGEGGSSFVYKVNCINKFSKYNENCKNFLALKIIKKSVCEDSNATKTESIEKWDDDDDDDDDDEVEEIDTKLQIDFKKMKKFFKEYECILKLQHPNIIKSFGFYQGDESMPPCILLEYFKHNLSNSITLLEDVYLVSIIYEICVAMEFVHKHGLIHCDLKPKNILLDNEKHVKICDFGIATLIPTETCTTSQTSTLGGTKGFIAPELYQGRKYTEKVDIFSFGVVMHFILTRGEIPVIDIVDAVKNKKIKLSSKINQNSNKLICRCLSISPDERPSFTEIVDFIKNKKMMLVDGIDDSNSILCSHLKNSLK